MRLFLQHLTAVFAALALAATCRAGTEQESLGSRPGLFFAWLSADDGPVRVHLAQARDLQALVQHCNGGREVFSLQTGASVHCQADVIHTEPTDSDWASVSITVQGAFPASDTRLFGLFSVTPPLTAQWIRRTLQPAEQAGVTALLQSDPQHFAAIRPQLDLTQAIALQQRADSPLAAIVPGARVVDEDGFYSAQRHQVFLRRGATWSYLGEIPGTPTQWVDLDGADLPGLIVEEGCDGWCISLWSMTDGLEQVATFGGH